MTLLTEEMTPNDAKGIYITDSMGAAMGKALVDEYDRTANEALNPVVKTSEILNMPIGFYNAAAWQFGDKTLLLGRQVNAPGAPGEGDPGPISLVVIENSEVVSNTKLWEPEAPGQKGDQLEDARVIADPDGIVSIGFTRLVYNHTKSKYEPFPAVSEISSSDLLRGRFPDTFILEDVGRGEETTPIGEVNQSLRLVSGKNATPIGHSKTKDMFMFRQEIHNHELTVVSLNNNKANVLQNLKFPEDQIPWWGEGRMGTTMPPVWLDDNEAIFLIHGFHYKDGKPQYAIGSARLYIDADNKFCIDNISQEPLLTPQVISKELFPGINIQLHPEERQAIYLCGGVVTYDTAGKPEFIYSYPSVGDSRTVESVFSVKALVGSWIK